MANIDIWIVLAFFAVIFGVGLWERKKLTLEDYWVNSRKTKKWILVATISSSFLGVASIIGNAGFAYSGGGLATLVLIGSTFFYFLIFARFFGGEIL